MTTPPHLPDSARFTVRAGRPTDEDVAALVVALDAARRSAAARRPEARRPAWLRAARREAVLGAVVASPTDLLSRD